MPHQAGGPPFGDLLRALPDVRTGGWPPTAGQPVLRPSTAASAKGGVPHFARKRGIVFLEAVPLSSTA